MNKSEWFYALVFGLVFIGLPVCFGFIGHWAGF